MCGEFDSGGEVILKALSRGTVSSLRRMSFESCRVNEECDLGWTLEHRLDAAEAGSRRMLRALESRGCALRMCSPPGSHSTSTDSGAKTLRM